HELARLAETIPGIANARLEIREEQDEVSFLYKVVPGAAQKSYGIYVAKLAGLPPRAVQRAGELLAGWQQEKERTTPALVVQGADHREVARAEVDRQNGRTSVQTVIGRLLSIDPLHTTPMEALLLLAELKKLAERERI
ncbi:MAG: MutS-related protein, partial [Candidatus Binatia bacterium]